MSRRIYLDECRRTAQARVLAEKLPSPATWANSDTNGGELPSEHHALMESSQNVRTAIGKAVDTALLPFHAATSKSAQKAYLGTILFVATSLLLLGVSTVAYTLFYYNFVPQAGAERVIHLHDGNPYGTATLSSTLTSLQPYDISLFLHLPRTPNNLAVGNFMLDLSLLSPNGLPSNLDTRSSTLAPGNTSSLVLGRSRRPAILTYASPIIDTATTLSGVPWYLLGWKKESEVLEVSMFESVEFAKGWRNVPQSVNVVVEADKKMQFYEVGIKIVARFGGLRWVLYHHRILSYFFFTTTFWASSVTTALIAWIILSSLSSPSVSTVKPEPERNDPTIKSERSNSEQFDPFSTEDLSDTSRSFPTLGRQMPLHFTGRNQIIKTGDDVNGVKGEEEEIVRSTGIEPFNAEADDEQDDEELETTGWRDSGIGTSLEEGDRRHSVQRRGRTSFGDRE